MTGWDVLNNLINGFPSIVATLMLVAAGVIFIIGFSYHGYNFLKYGFKQIEITDLSAKIDELRTEFKTEMGEFRTELSGFRTELNGFRTELNGFKTELSGFKTELETIKVNHFGHLKNFLTELTSILVDKGVINNENKARLDNQLRGM